MVEQEAHGRAQIVAVVVEAVDPFPVVRALEVELDTVGEFHVVLGVPGADGLEGAARLELFERVLPNGREHREVRPALAVLLAHEAVVDEDAEAQERIGMRGITADELDGFEREAAREYPEQGEKALLVGAEKLRAPLDRAA